MKRKYQTTASGLSVSDTGDFFQLRNAAAVVCYILEIRVWQTSDTDLAMNGIKFHRGASGAGGTGLTEYEWDVSGIAASATAFSLPTSDVSADDLDLRYGWNILQELVLLPPPNLSWRLAASDDMGLALVNADTLTVGCTVIWEEEAA